MNQSKANQSSLVTALKHIHKHTIRGDDRSRNYKTDVKDIMVVEWNERKNKTMNLMRSSTTTPSLDASHDLVSPLLRLYVSIQEKEQPRKLLPSLL